MPSEPPPQVTNTAIPYPQNPIQGLIETFSIFTNPLFLILIAVLFVVIILLLVFSKMGSTRLMNRRLDVNTRTLLRALGIKVINDALMVEYNTFDNTVDILTLTRFQNNVYFGYSPRNNTLKIAIIPPSTKPATLGGIPVYFGLSGRNSIYVVDIDNVMQSAIATTLKGSDPLDVLTALESNVDFLYGYFPVSKNKSIVVGVDVGKAITSVATANTYIADSVLSSIYSQLDQLIDLQKKYLEFLRHKISMGTSRMMIIIMGIIMVIAIIVLLSHVKP